MHPLHQQKRRQNVTLALILGAVALLVLLLSLPVWRNLFTSIGGGG